MAEEESTKSNVADVANAVAAVAKEVPIYQDALQPAAQEIGKALGTVAKLVNVALIPVSVLVWGYDQIREFTATKVAEKLKNVPLENIITPHPNVAGPAIEALRYTGHEESLSEMYASLLATAMNRDTVQNAHPAFVDIIKQMTPDEAKIVRGFAERDGIYPLVSVHASIDDENPLGGHTKELRNFSLIGQKAGCEFIHLVPAYIDNLVRLGLCVIPEGTSYTDDEVYNPLNVHPVVTNLINEIEKSNRKADIVKGAVIVTDFGSQFAMACCPPNIVTAQSVAS